MSATRSKWFLELSFLALVGLAIPALAANQGGIEFAGHVAVGPDSVALTDCGSADGRHKVRVERSDFDPVNDAKACPAPREQRFDFTATGPDVSSTKSILIDEPSVSRVTLPVPNPPNASCPGGFFIATVDDGPGAGLAPGAFGMELLLDEPGTRVLAGGINFGGLVDAGQVGFAGFNFTNTANENQRFNLSLRGSPSNNSAGTLQVRVKIMRSISATSSETVFDSTGDLTLAAASVAQIVVPPGFYVATVEPRGISVGTPGGAPEGQFFFELTTSFVDRPGGGFQGGVVVGGYHATHPFGGVSGFGAFCLPTPHSASVRVLSAPTYGASGARDLRLRILDAAQAEVVSVPGTPKTLSGELIAVSDSYVDGDVNNPAVPNRDNDDPSQAQTIGNPAIVAGFAAHVPTTRAGDRFATTTDQIDAYRATITAGQTLQLIISDWSSTAPTTKDLDLFVYAASNPSQPLFSAIGTDKNEFIQIPETGQYDIVVFTFAGYSNYVLAVSNAPPPPATAAMLKLEDAGVIPGEVIVRFDEPSPEDPGKAVLAEPARSLKARTAQLGLEGAQGEPGRPMLFRWSGTGQVQRALTKLGAGSLKSIEASGFGLSEEQRARWAEIALIKALRADPEVRYAEWNRQVHAFAVPNDPRYREQWHYPLINLPQAWDVTTGSSNVVVAVIDTGIGPHPDLEGNVRRDLGADMISSPSNSCDGTGRDLDADDVEHLCPGLQSSPSFHGTHVAGTITASTNNAARVAGVSWLSKIMPVRVLGRFGGDLFDINDGIRWAAGMSISGGQAPRRADVINMSLGGPADRPVPCSAAEQEAINSALSQGLIIVVAAGNENQPTKSPANCQGVIAVAAVDRDGNPAAYSNTVPLTGVAAPGGQNYSDAQVVNSRLFAPLNGFQQKPPKLDRIMGAVDDVLSTAFFSSPGSGVRTPQEKYLHGTSMAAPHVAGVIALMKAVHPGLTNAQLASLVTAGRITNDDPYRQGPDIYTGAGIIDAFKAVSEARTLAGGGAAPARITVMPTELDFGEAATVLPIVVGATAAGVTVNSAVSSQPWLTVSGSGIGNYQAQVNRGTLLTGNYQGTITFTPSAGSPVIVNARMRVGARATTGNVSTVYGFLLDAEGEVVAQGQLDNVQGRYPFFVPELEPGSYYFVAGSDNDNDLTICDAGESCAVYPSFANFGPIQMGTTDLNLGGFPIAPDTLGIGSNGTAAEALHDPDKSAAAARIGRGFTFRRADAAKGFGESGVSAHPQETLRSGADSSLKNER